MLVLIILVAAVLRLVFLGSYPVSLGVDEVSIGYNAYSLLKTGLDQYQKPLPLVFTSLGDFKPPVYIYLTTASEAVFGLNEFAVRFPAAFFGVISVYVVFLISKRLTGSTNVALITSLVFAISPWHLRLSRGAYEATVSLTLMLIGFYYFLDLKHVSLSLVIFILAIHTYHAPKVFVPLFLAGLGLIYFTRLWSDKRRFLPALVTGFLLFIPTLWLSFAAGGQTRVLQTFIAGDSDLIRTLNQTVVHPIFNRNWLIFSSIINHYLQYFDPTHLFFHGLDLSRGQILDLGVGYLIELPFFITGLFYMIIAGRSVISDPRFRKAFWIWTFLSPLPASFTLNQYHIIRSLPFVLSMSFFVAIGLYQLHRRFTRLGFLTIFGYGICVVFLIDYFVIHSPMQKSDYSFDPLKQVTQVALKNQSLYSQIIIDPQFGKDGPYLVGIPDVYLLFYGKIHPRTYWQSRTTEGFSNFAFRHIEWTIDKGLSDTLLIGSPWSLPQKDIDPFQIQQVIPFYNQQPAYYVVKT